MSYPIICELSSVDSVIKLYVSLKSNKYKKQKEVNV